MVMLIGLVTLVIGGNSLSAQELTVSNTKQPAASLAPEGAARLPFTNFVLTAGVESDVVIRGIVIRNTGSISNGAFTDILLIDQDGMVPTEAITIPAGESRIYSIAANMQSNLDAYAGEVGGLAITTVDASAPTHGSLPILGAQHTVNATLTIGSVMFKQGVFDPENSQEKRIGTTGYNFSSVTIVPAGESLWLKSIRWKQTGSAIPSDISNVVTVVQGIQYPTTQSWGYYTTIFPNEGLLTERGQHRDITIRGDIVSGSGRTIDFDIYSRTDIHLVGDTFGYGVIPPFGSDTDNDDDGMFRSTNYPYYDAHQVTILPPVGTISVIADPEIPAQNIAVGLVDQILGGFIVEVENEPITVSKIAMGINIFTQSGSSPAMEDVTSVKIVDENGVVLAGAVDSFNSEKYPTLIFTDHVTFPIGITKIRLLGKLSNNFGMNDMIKLSTIPSTYWSGVRGDVTGSVIVPTPNTIEKSSWMTAIKPVLDIYVSSNSLRDKAVAGASQFTFASYVFDATRSGEDIRITHIPLKLSFEGIESTDLSGCRLWDGTTSVTGNTVLHPSVATGENETFTFDGGGLIIPKGTSRTLELRCNTSSSAISGSVIWSIDESIIESNGIGAFGAVSYHVPDITITTTDEMAIILVQSGAYHVLNAMYPLYRMVQAGDTDVTLARFHFGASDVEDIRIHRIHLELGNPDLNSPSDLVNEEVTLWNGPVQIGVAKFVGADSDFAISQLVVPFTIKRDESVTITVKGDLNDQPAWYSQGPGSFLVINYDGERDNWQDGNYGIGLDSGATIEDNNLHDVHSAGVRIFRTVLYITANNTGGTLAPGADLYQFTVTNPSDRDASFQKFTFSAGVAGTIITGWTLYGDGVAFNSPTEPSGGRLELFGKEDSQAGIVSANSAKSYVLKVNTVTDIPSDGAYVILSLLTDKSFPWRVDKMGTVEEIEEGFEDSNNIIWSPHSKDLSSPLEDSDWTNSYGMPGFPGPGINFGKDFWSRDGIRHYESDVAPRETGGDGRVTVADWIQVGRLVVGLDQIFTPEEFRKADCAPLRSKNGTLVKGDGTLTISDWVQTGLNAAGLDPRTLMGGSAGVFE